MTACCENLVKRSLRMQPLTEIPYSQMLLNSPHLFMRDVFGYRADGVHAEFIDHMESGNRTLLLAPRGHGKSKCAQALIAWEMLRNRNGRIVLVSDTYSKAVLMMSGIKRVFETSDVLQDTFGDLVGDVWRDNAMSLTGRNALHIEPSLMAMGSMSGAITGVHEDHIYLDDVISFDSVRSDVQSERLDSWFKMTLYPTLQPEGTITALGTRYGFNDLYQTMIDMGYNTKIFPAIRDGGALIPWLRPMKDEMRDGALVIGLETMKKDMGSLLFSLQMLNDTSLLLENNIIKAKWIKYYDELPTNVSNILISVDPAISQKSEADYTAIGVWCKDADNNVYLIDYTNAHLTMNRTIIQIQEYISRYDAERVLVEDVGYQKSLIQELTRLCSSTAITGRTVTTDKRARLINVQNYFENGLVHFKHEQTDVVDNIIYFPGAHDDLVDMTTIAVAYYKEISGSAGVVIW